TALKVISGLLARRVNDQVNGRVNGHDGPGGQPTVAPDRALAWDEANSDIC
ncbi:MAG: hypothetical protein QOD01_1669, partial [Actinomycetota bacterium]|nr:hypothetical protein [Actinomycetota bacterium]